MRALLAVLLSGAMLPAQNPQQDKAPVKFTVTTQLVTLNFTAKDKDGNLIPGIKPSDIQLFEDGKKQTIAICEFQKLDDTLLEALPAPPTSATAPATVAAPPAPPPAVTPSNVIASGKPGEIKYKDRRLMVLYFDMTSMPVQDQIRAEENALKFLAREMSASDTVAVMSFTNRLNLLQDFTTDRDRLSKVIKGLVVGEGSDLSAAGATAGDDNSATGAAFTADDTEFNIFNADRKLIALQSAIKALGALPEKKALMYFSSGFTKTGNDNDAQMRATTNAAIRHNVALFPVDARGLSAMSPTGDATKGAGSAAGSFGGSGIANLAKLRASQEPLKTLAAETGGKELVDNNDLARGIVEAQKVISSYYVVGYYSTNQTLDGQFRRIRVQLNNQPTAKLDYRSGYFAGKEFKQFTASDRDRQLQEALLLGDPLTDLSLKLELNFFRLAQDRYFVPLVAKIPGSEIDLSHHGDGESARLDFVGQVTDTKTNKVVRQVRDNLEVKLKGLTSAELAKKNLAYDTGFELAPGTYVVKFLARENTSGKMGTFETKLVIPDLAAEKSWLPISSVVLSNQIEAVASAVATGAQDRKALADHPLIQNGQKMVPSVTRAFRRDQNLFVYFEAFEPEALQPLQATVSFYRGKTKVYESPAQIVKDGLKEPAKVLPVKLTVPLQALDPGRYTCQVNVLNMPAQKVAFWRAPIAVMP